MRALVDTSARIETLIGSATGSLVGEKPPAEADRLVPTIVQLELAKWLARDVGDDDADRVLAFTQICRVVVLDTDLSLAAAEICRSHRLATADAIVLATARRHDAALLTCDPPFAAWPGVEFVAKAHAP